MIGVFAANIKKANAGMKEIRTLKMLRRQGHRALKELSLYNQRVTDNQRGAEPGATQVTDKGLLELKGLMNLRRLRVDGAK